MNYVILNGVESTTIAGLIIQELPPISKPMVRTQVETIDGRDGDIVTKLGYSAYDKEMSIGLRSSSNINDVIRFFDSEGAVTFSNEPDKVYLYQITDQIDFERLLRYRTARVTFHVQPFKYSVTEQLLTASSSPMTVTNSGNVESRPIYTIYGSGNIGLSINSIQILAIQLGDTGNITIDSASMEAYQGNVLRNRLVTGDYAKLALPAGQNTISWTGNVSEVTISNYSRWI